MHMLLYHYTNQAGFLGIMESATLWATKIQYLNDNKEFFLALTIADEILKERLRTEINREVVIRLIRFREALPRMNDVNVCVCSLSENGDLLSQWRGYAAGLGGYSIGFDYEALKAGFNQHDYVLMKCRYQPQEHEAFINNVIDTILMMFEGLPEPDHDNIEKPSAASRLFQEHLSCVAAVLKDSSFSEEAEWRAISRRSLSPAELAFRPGHSTLTPYHKLPFDNRQHGCLREVIVGHTPNSDLAIAATHTLMQKMGLQVALRASQIPFRNW
ncbi:hypothetical protein CYR32_01710 [Chimaeribacter coloradensis]|uniref:DUF2971 domain-containing protein n=2 Tax=Chimaeribacter coloradensis TaxID=2060068 RepID=A0A2N5ED58_9GAMM|nr:hypothetical protein CYR32_01710 [Chimaeribacter coloradensis]